MTNILTASEASVVLRTETTDADMLALLPMVDDYIKNATGHDWTSDATIDPSAKAAARMLIAQWHENPMMVGSESSMLGPGLKAVLTQLEVKSLQYMEFFGLNGAGAISLPRAYEGDKVNSVVAVVGATGVYSSSFETVISETGQIQQTSDSDLSEYVFRAKLISPADISITEVVAS